MRDAKKNPSKTCFKTAKNIPFKHSLANSFGVFSPHKLFTCNNRKTPTNFAYSIVRRHLDFWAIIFLTLFFFIALYVPPLFFFYHNYLPHDILYHRDSLSRYLLHAISHSSLLFYHNYLRNISLTVATILLAGYLLHRSFVTICSIVSLQWEITVMRVCLWATRRRQLQCKQKAKYTKSNHFAQTVLA